MELEKRRIENAACYGIGKAGNEIAVS